MTSLKSFLPLLAKFTGYSTTALYERQRALVRIGLLPAPTQTGRNSGGAQVNADTVSMMLISVLATDRLSDVSDVVPRYVRLRSRGSGELSSEGFQPGCCHTGEKTLGKALAATLAGRSGIFIPEIIVERNIDNVTITAAASQAIPSTFGKPDPRPSRWRLHHEVRFQGLWDIIEELRNIP